MKVLLINTLFSGGAANSAIRLHSGLLKREINSSFLLFPLSEREIQNSESFYLYHKTIFLDQITKRNILQKVLRRFFLLLKKDEECRIEEQRKIVRKINRSKPSGFEVFTFPYTPYRVHLHPWVKETSIIHLHWVNDFLDYKSFFGTVDKPIVWTLHEMNPFTGGCSYDYGCGKYNSGCHLCPQLEGCAYPAESEKILKLKMDALKRIENLHVVAPSRWLMQLSKQSQILGKFPHYHIPYGIDETIFKYQDKAYLAGKYGYNDKKITILFAAGSLANKRKGLGVLIEALRLLKSQNPIRLLLIGSSQFHFDEQETINFGEINDEAKMAEIFSLSDFFVIPSIEDNLPNTVLESIMCGTPVIGFPVGGIPEMIQHGVNGMLCKDISELSLAETISNAIENISVFNKEHISANARELYGLDIQARNYIKLYEDILASS